MDNLMESEAFCTGVMVGIDLQQQQIIAAHERKEPLIVNGNVYYIQDGIEKLEQTIDKICR